MRGGLVFAAALLTAAGAQAQPATEAAGFEFGVRYWLSSGMTRRSHDASRFPPLANPTSTLEYDDMWANSIELYARKALGEKWWVKGSAGVGRINTGTFTDQDFIILNGDLFYAETVSGMDGDLKYGSLDIGREVWRRGSSALSVFVGYSQWNEQLTAYGFTRTTGIGGSFDNSIPVIANDLTWKAARLGLAATAERGRTRYAVEVAYVPYATFRNEDSHFLRQGAGDLGPAPNVIGEGRGTGFQFELEVRRVYPQLWDLEFGFGIRWWKLASSHATQAQAGMDFPLDLKSERLGGLFSVGKRW
jgi:hypothetical protein